MSRLQDRGEFPEHELEISSQFDKAAVELLSRVHMGHDVDLERAGPVVVWRGESEPAIRSGVGDVHVDAPEVFAGCGEQCRHTLGGGAIAGDGSRVDLPRSDSQAVRVEVVDDHAHAFGHESRGDRTTDSPRGAGHDDARALRDHPAPPIPAYLPAPDAICRQVPTPR